MTSFGLTLHANRSILYNFPHSVKIHFFHNKIHDDKCVNVEKYSFCKHLELSQLLLPTNNKARCSGQNNKKIVQVHVTNVTLGTEVKIYIFDQRHTYMFFRFSSPLCGQKEMATF